MIVYKIQCHRCGKEYDMVNLDKEAPCCPGYWMYLRGQLKKYRVESPKDY